MRPLRVGDRVVDPEGDEGVIRGVDPVRLEWDCRPGVTVEPHPVWAASLLLVES